MHLSCTCFHLKSALRRFLLVDQQLPSLINSAQQDSSRLSLWIAISLLRTVLIGRVKRISAG
ncbi:hypothetical protein I7I53_12230 [Histoplasma capsulatum var. duboisii H88]|uniref:Uncharacterized protein n=1 Tax=Ajellomyces capsulatus (strain H88) TaxID=544711 RepID=A0A8A1LVU7_AJEC8|nr:hypothetical protein I7I53_12230 [Histoplasma capsulatum var. duboisii H88]